MSIAITSLSNQHIKDVVKLEKRSERARRQRTIVEGVREISRCFRAGIVPVEAYLCPELATDAALEPALATLKELDRARRTHLYTVPPEIYAKLAVREASGGLLLVIPYLPTALAQLPRPQVPFYAVIDQPEKPGNVGAILRTADAARVDGVIVCGGTDLHNPNVVRASLGTLFTVPVAEATAREAIAWLRSHNVQIVATTPAAAVRYTAARLTGPVAVVMGSEAYGLSAEWLEAADMQVVIPMFGQADSLNLATATALLLYEVVRQRLDAGIFHAPEQ